jgi:hypothetical protein
MTTSMYTPHALFFAVQVAVHDSLHGFCTLIFPAFAMSAAQQQDRSYNWV